MKYYTTKAKIRESLIATLSSPPDGMMFDPDFGIRVRATSMGSGSHRYWLTGDLEKYEVHCFGQGRGWADQGDDCSVQDIDALVSYLWKNRAQIVEPAPGY